jgi:hypothetical protein
MKWNWYRGLSNLFSKHISYLFELNAEDRFDVSFFKSQLNSFLSEMSSNLMSTDISRMTFSKNNPVYKTLRTHIKLDDFYNCTLNWGMIRNIVQLRSYIPRLTIKGRSVNLNAMRSCFDKNHYEFENCTLCTKKEKEDAFHIMFVCPACDLTRRVHLRDYLHINNELDFFSFLRGVDNNKLNSRVWQDTISKIQIQETKYKIVFH